MSSLCLFIRLDLTTKGRPGEHRHGIAAHIFDQSLGLLNYAHCRYDASSSFSVSAPFLVDGISAVANKMAGGLMGLVGGNGHSNDHHHHDAHQFRRDERENAGVLGSVKNDDDQSTMIVDVVSCNDPAPTTTY